MATTITKQFQHLTIIQTFIDWASLRCEDAKYINTASSAQIQQLFFGEQRQGTLLNGNSSKVFQIAKEAEEFEEEQAKLLEENPYVNHNAAMLKAVLKEKGKNFIEYFILRFIITICNFIMDFFLLFVFFLFIFLLRTFLLFIFLFFSFSLDSYCMLK